MVPALAVIIRIHIGSLDREKKRESRAKWSVTTKKTRKIDFATRGRRDFRRNKTGSTLNFISVMKNDPKELTFLLADKIQLSPKPVPAYNDAKIGSQTKTILQS